MLMNILIAGRNGTRGTLNEKPENLFKASAENFLS
jgi:hypothetical protein